MNRGAEIANGDTLLFLHSDTTLPENAITRIEEAMKNHKIIGGRFDVGFDDDRFIFKLIAFLMNWRSRLTGIFTGDQAIFIRKSVFKDIGGYLQIPLMEDIALSKKMKKAGRAVCLKTRLLPLQKVEGRGDSKNNLIDVVAEALYFFQ